MDVWSWGVKMDKRVDHTTLNYLKHIYDVILPKRLHVHWTTTPGHYFAYPFLVPFGGWIWNIELGVLSHKLLVQRHLTQVQTSGSKSSGHHVWFSVEEVAIQQIFSRLRNEAPCVFGGFGRLVTYEAGRAWCAIFRNHAETREAKNKKTLVFPSSWFCASFWGAAS